MGESKTNFKKDDTNLIETTAFVHKQKETLILLRNSKTAHSINDDVRFESDRVHDYAIAVMRDGVLHLQTERIPAFFSLPYSNKLT